METIDIISRNLLVWNSTTVAEAISKKMCFKRAECI